MIGEAMAVAGMAAVFVGAVSLAGWQWGLILAGVGAMFAGAIMARPTEKT